MDQIGMRGSPAARPWWPRVLLVLGVALAVALFFALGLHRHLSWESLQENRAQLRDLVDEHWVLALVVFFCVYVAVAGLSLPGATVMTLAAGFLFDLLAGTVVVSFASTAGATLAFLLARYLLGGSIQDRWGQRLAAINRGVERDGPFYLFTLRLVPAFPFFVINVAMGLTRMPVRTFWWVSQLGMLPGTVLYVNAGMQLGEIASPRAILSPTILLSFAALGLAPLLFRLVVRRVRRERGQVAEARAALPDRVLTEEPPPGRRAG